MSFVQHEPEPRHRAEAEIPPTADVPIIRKAVWWMGLVQAILAALTSSTAFMDLHPAIPGTLGTIMLVLGAVQMYLEKPIQSQVTSNHDVVEARVGNDVVAGEANVLEPAGTRIRDVSGSDLPQTIPPSVE